MSLETSRGDHDEELEVRGAVVGNRWHDPGSPRARPCGGLGPQPDGQGDVRAEPAGGPHGHRGGHAAVQEHAAVDAHRWEDPGNSDRRTHGVRGRTVVQQHGGAGQDVGGHGAEPARERLDGAAREHLIQAGAQDGGVQQTESTVGPGRAEVCPGRAVDPLGDLIGADARRPAGPDQRAGAGPGHHGHLDARGLQDLQDTDMHGSPRRTTGQDEAQTTGPGSR